MAELRRWPLWGFAASIGDTIFVDRATRRDVIRVRDEMAQARERGDTVIVFPEATSTAGETILPLKPALLADAAAAGTPVHWLTPLVLDAAGRSARPRQRLLVGWRRVRAACGAAVRAEEGALHGAVRRRPLALGRPQGDGGRASARDAPGASFPSGRGRGPGERDDARPSGQTTLIAIPCGDSFPARAGSTN